MKAVCGPLPSGRQYVHDRLGATGGIQTVTVTSTVRKSYGHVIEDSGATWSPTWQSISSSICHGLSGPDR